MTIKVYTKLYHLFAAPVKHIIPFDLADADGATNLTDWMGEFEATQPKGVCPDCKRNDPGYSRYVYDPSLSLSTPNCDPGKRSSKCYQSWVTKRDEDLSLTPRKVLRLAFHDCAKYKDGSGGCDGCINFDENFGDNHGLQYAVAVLVSFKNFDHLIKVPYLLK